MRQTTCFSVFALALTTALVAPSFGQNLGEITGVVTDASGAVVVGAAVTVSNPTTNFTRQSATNASGVYDFPALQPGAYNVKTEAQGFQVEIRNGMDLQVGQVARVDFQLKVGSTTETVEVAAGAVMLNTESAAVGTVVENKRIEDLPLNGRNFVSLVQLSPNVSAGFNATSSGATGGANTRQGGDRSTQSVSVAGQRREFNFYTLDGVNNTDVNYNTYIFLPSIDALQEFKVQTGVYSAEFGRELGQINVSTKSGTNDYHGVVFEFLRNDKLDALPFGFTSKVPTHAPLRLNQYGFTLGGPVEIPKLFHGKDRLFFMSNYEGQRELKQTQALFSVGSAAMRTGDFSQLLPNTVIKDPLNGNVPFAGNIIPQTRLSSVAQGLLAYEPLPNVPGAALANNFQSLQNNTINKDQFNQRIDFVENSKSSWFGRFSWGGDSGISPFMYQNGTDLNLTVYQTMLANTRVLSPTLVNEARFGFNYFNNANLHDLTNKTDVTSQLGLQVGNFGPLDYGIPGIQITSFSEIGGPDEGPYYMRNRAFDWSDSVIWVHGSHSLKFGGDIRRDRFNNYGNYAARGAFTVQNQATGYGFSDFMLGELEQTIKSFADANTEFRATSQAYYIDDTWKARPNLTFNLGLRYEFTPPWNDKSDMMSNVEIPYLAYTPALGAVTTHPTICRANTGDFYNGAIVRFNPAIQVANDGCLGGGSLVKADYKNFAPRVGIAWSPTSKWTIRTGVGVFYVQDIGNGVFDVGRNMQGRLQTVANLTTHDLTFSNPYHLSGTTNACGVTAPLACESTPGLLAVQYNRRTPYVEQAEFNIQRQLTHDTVLEVGYFGSESHFLQRFHNINNPVVGTGSTVPRTPWPELNPIQYVDGDVNANYNSLTAKLTRRLTGGLTYMVAYTFSKSIDDGSGIRSFSQDSGEQNQACISCERGLSVFNQKQRFVASALYNLPFGKGAKLLNRGGVVNAIVGGWEISSIITASTGSPNGVATGSSRSGAGGDRPNAVYGQTVALSNPTPNEWFNIGAFAENAIGAYGDVGRNTVIGPGVLSWDGSILRNFNFTENRLLQFRFEIFNAANHPNFADPATSVAGNQINASTLQPIPGTGTFGTINATRANIDMRELQFSLKFVF